MKKTPNLRYTISFAPYLYEFLPMESKSDPEILSSFLRSNEPHYFALVPPEIQKQAILSTINPEFFLYCTPEIREDREIVLAYIEADRIKNIWMYLPEKIRNDKEVVEKYFQKAASSLSGYEKASIYPTLSEDLRNDKEITLQAVQWVNVLQYASEKLKADRDVVLMAMKKNPQSLMHADKKLWNDPQLWEVFVKGTPYVGDAFSVPGLFDKKNILDALQHKGDIYNSIEDKFLSDPDILLAACKSGESIINRIPEEHKKDKELMKVLMSHYGLDFNGLPDELQQDKELALIAVKNSGMALGCMGEKFRGDFEVVYHAVSQNGLALVSASDELRANDIIAEKAVGNNIEAMQYLKGRTKNNPVVAYEWFNYKGNDKDKLAKFLSLRLKDLRKSCSDEEFGIVVQKNYINHIAVQKGAEINKAPTKRRI